MQAPGDLIAGVQAMDITTTHRVGALSLLFFLSACGGGGDEAPSPTAAAPTPPPSTAPAPPPAAPAPAPTPPPAAPPIAPPDGVLSSCNLPNFGADLLKRINDVRAAGANCGSEGVFAPTGALVWNALLTRAADGHSQDMAAGNYFSHTSADGRTMSDRINASGYRWSRIGENIAAGQPSVNSVMDGWVASAGHCANIMQPQLKDVGVSCVPGTSSSRYRTYWTMNLGTPR
jgi:uncharacterized protein YkwD